MGKGPVAQSGQSVGLLSLSVKRESPFHKGGVSRGSRVQIPPGPLIQYRRIKEERNLKMDISKHVLVPKHEVLTEEEAEEVLKKYNITKSQLPKILISDPMVKKIGAKVGDIIKITRKSPTAGESIFYRVVVSE